MAAEHNDGVETQERGAQPTLSIRATIPVVQLGEVMGERLQALRAFMVASGVAPAGPPFVRYFTFETETDLEIGVPMHASAPGEGDITSGDLPGGAVITTWHDGAHDRLGEAYGRIGSWLERSGTQRRGPAWEVYHWIDLGDNGSSTTGIDPANWRTELVQPIT